MNALTCELRRKTRKRAKSGEIRMFKYVAWGNVIGYFINRNIGVLSGRLLLLEGVNKTFVVWVELSSVILRDHFVSLP